MLLEALYHRPKQNYAYAYDEKTLHIRLRTKRNDVSKVELIYGDKYDWDATMAKKEMTKIASDQLFDYYQTETIPSLRRQRYAFHVSSGKEEIWYTEKGFYHEAPKDSFSFFEFPFLNPIDVITVPEWVKDAVFYQIFPERFANGDTRNDPKDVVPWGSVPTPQNFFGGDLQGVLDHIDYLVNLGINAIYFTPIFTATSNHKYDTIDYLQVDPHFGDNALLKKLVQKCHDNGIRVVLDAVFNHAGYFFEPFQDVIKNGQKSRYADWFHIRSFPIEIEPRPNYDVFAFTHMMPKLNTENAEVKEYLLKVARYWIEEIGIDGWRLDVANEVDHVFWRDFRKVVKEAKRDAYILGEVWHDSLPWLQGDQFDAIMNYPVAVSAISFFSKGEIDAEQFAAQVDNVFANYPQQINEVTFNVLDSHDTARLLNISGFNKDRMKLASTFQFTYIGTPCLYYGDEIGLDGEHDPGCRKSFEWDEAKQDRELHQFYQQLIHIRKSHESLRSGSFTFLLREKGSKQIAYSRKHKDETIVVVLNASEEKATITLPLENGTYVNLWTNESIEVTNHTCMLNAHGFGHYLFKKVGQL